MKLRFNFLVLAVLLSAPHKEGAAKQHTIFIEGKFAARQSGEWKFDQDRPLTTPFDTAKPSVAFTRLDGSPFKSGTAYGAPIVADINHDGYVDIIVPGSGVTVLLGNQIGSFTPSPTSPVAPTLQGISFVDVGDFNGDGKLDILALYNRLPGPGPLAPPGPGTSPLPQSGVYLLLGDGLSGFGNPVLASSVVSPTGFAVTDFNGDGRADFAVVNHSSTVSVFLGDGQGRFIASGGGSFSAPGPSADTIVAGDFNGDGKADVAVTTSSTITVLLGDGNGGLPVVASVLLVGSTFGIPVTADFNQDRNLDLAMVSTGGVTILLGDGAGRFTTSADSSISISGLVTSIVAADFDLDGKQDLAISVAQKSGDPLANKVTLYMNRTDGTLPSAVLDFRSGASSPPTGDSTMVAVGDVNGDGRLDLIAAGLYETNVNVFPGNFGLTVRIDAKVPSVGKEITYTLAVKNETNKEIAGEVTVTDTFVAGLVPQNWSAAGWVCSITGQNVTCRRSGSLPAGSGYPAINISVKIGGAICTGPTVANHAEVSFMDGNRTSDFFSTPVYGCLTITQSHQPFIAGAKGAITITVAASAEVPVPDSSLVRVIAAAGFIFDSWSGQGWMCTFRRSDASCSRSSALGTNREYPELVLMGTVDTLNACPRVIGGDPALKTAASVLLDESFEATTEPDTVDIHGCLSIETSLPGSESPVVIRADQGPATIIPFPSPLLLGTPGTSDIIVRSLDKSELSVRVQAADDSAFSAIAGPECVSLSGGNTCSIRISFQPACLGREFATFAIVTNLGASYFIAMSSSGIPETVSFEGVPEQLKGDGQYSVNLKLAPAPADTCRDDQKAQVRLGFFPLPPDRPPTDAQFIAPTSTLRAGTVAGSIRLRAVTVDGNFEQPLSPKAGIDYKDVFVPSEPGVIKNVSIEKHPEASYFLVRVAGFSTPRETGDTAKTEVCLKFSAAPRATLLQDGEACALRQDIQIWYERTASYMSGSQFAGTINVPYSGKIDAIGGMKVVLKNKEGDSQPYCMDFKGAKKLDACPQ